MKKIILMMLLCAPLSIFAQKFGHFNAAEIMKAMPEAKTAETELQTLQNQYQDELKRMQEEGQKKYDAYLKQRDSLPENIRARREEEIQTITERIQQTNQENSAALQKAYQEKQQIIMTKVLDAVKAVGDAGQYVYIMDINGGVPYINTNLSKDLTAEIKTKLGLK